MPFALNPDRSTRGAVIAGPYRYHLWRDAEAGRGRICFVMLNPSTADENIDDPTVRKCIYYARAWQFRRLDIVNLFALRATDPKELLTAESPRGTGNDEAIGAVARASDMVMCAWGRLDRKLAHRAPQVLRMFQSRSLGVMCLGLNNDMSPKHPLYLKNDLQPMQWAAPAQPKETPR